ncbi:unnamed protein product [Rotaria socialis]|uniref:Uncharacterized protein n=1 Tax=Rotaria socialis TaxID=392032 RepID=A0A817MTX8_9BILA|nr:unnamed protein product [Rotaria socialis]CAF3354205.1 unnamed protein product [Rotaria socialis]CAF3367671.1 unnamed protein product [Rotaria socialis]CAF3394612.1 unnamed protein product [Rotaria socialis]CAF3394873.1 unnamed protein product [Rotaria socialis]
MASSVIVFTNAFTFIPANEKINAGLMDTTELPISDVTNRSEQQSLPVSNVDTVKQKNKKMKFQLEQAESFKKKHQSSMKNSFKSFILKKKIFFLFFKQLDQ